jgi:glucan phosphoethanolaminetransferase (alkaline phosphatase superfamily)
MPLKDIEELSIETENILKAVIKKQNKKDKYEGLRNMYLIVTLLLLLGFFVFLNINDIRTMLDPFSTFASILLNPMYLITFLVIAFTFSYYRYYQKKLKKEKDKLNKVRAEAIDYLNDSKDLNLQDKVPRIKKMMKDDYNINLYVKNK